MKVNDLEAANDESAIDSESASETLLARGFSRPMTAIGRIPLMRARMPCVVIGEGWPAWVPILPSLGAKVTVVVGPVKERLCDEEDGDLAWLEVGSAAATRFLKALPADMLVFISGSTMFVKGLAAVLSSSANVVVALDTGNRISAALCTAFLDIRWMRLAHAEVGGVTSARNWIGAGVGVELGSVLKNPYHRSIGEVLQSTLKGQFGRPRPAPASRIEESRTTEQTSVIFEGPQLVSPNGLWPTHFGGLRIISPSVFSDTGWVWRALDPMELGSAWDLPVHMVKSLKRLDGGGGESMMQAMERVCRTAPCKSLWAFGHAMQCFRLQEETWVNTGLGTLDVTTKRVGFGMVEKKSADEKETTEDRGVESDLARRTREAKAVKADDAEVPVHLWNARIRTPGFTNSDPSVLINHLSAIRELFLFRRWKQNLRRCFVTYLKDEYGTDWYDKAKKDAELRKDLETGRDALHRGMSSSWWGWDAGSTLFFWRWPKEFRKEARDGTHVRVSGMLPKYRQPQRMVQADVYKDKILAKLENVRDRGYIKPGAVVSLTSFFAVPKGDSDIRMVYDATKSGLNEVVWAPSFGLPTVDATLRGIDAASFMSDIDLGEMFLNFPLDAKLRPYAGIDLSAFPVRGREGSNGNPDICWERWERCLMGFKPSPYNATRAFAWCEELIRGDGQEEENPLRWEQLRMNLPGESDYNPTLPWVSKTWGTGEHERIAGDFFSYVDDIRVCGVNDDHCWEVSRKVASQCQYLGIQDAPRKRRAPSQTPGAWAGSNVVITMDGIAVTVSQERWDKTKAIVSKWSQRLTRASDVNRKDLESDVGFLIYVTRTYPAMKPYLKGFHLTLHGWRPGREDSGWRSASLKVEQEDHDDWQFDLTRDSGFTSDLPEPEQVLAVPRLRDDLRALLVLTEAMEPSLRLVRPIKVNAVRYGFGDASGSGFGSTFQVQESILYRHGIWGSDGEGKSSNWRELTNLVEALELEARESRLKGCEVFMFTDNSTAESAFFRGTSSSERLFLLVLRLRKLEVEYQCLIHVIHVAGTRMIGQGSDGLSRGNLTEGVMTGQAMINHVPLGKTALERSPVLESWIRSWSGNDLEVLCPKDWFLRGQGLDGFTRDKISR